MKQLIDRWRKAEHKWDVSATMFGANDEGMSAVAELLLVKGLPLLIKIVQIC